MCSNVLPARDCFGVSAASFACFGVSAREDLAAFGVSATFAGHVHAYERTHPVCFDERRESGIVHITIGLTGQWYRNHFDDPTYARDWSAVRDDARYGHGRLTVVNDSMAKWQFVPNIGGGDQGDTVWITNRYVEGACDATPPAPATDCAEDTGDAVDARVAAATRAPTDDRFTSDSWAKVSAAESTTAAAGPLLAFLCLLTALR